MQLGSFHSIQVRVVYVCVYVCSIIKWQEGSEKLFIFLSIGK